MVLFNKGLKFALLVGDKSHSVKWIGKRAQKRQVGKIRPAFCNSNQA
ncbi:hypothetical protein ACLBWS_07730 [Brucellaceae bacterium D45D]